MARIALGIVAALALAAVFSAAPAQAQNGSLTRSFVSASGLDTNACTITAPCATFAHAYTMVGANGIIAALDPGKYGPITITGPVTINGNGWAAITAPAQGNGITVNANTANFDAVSLIGLEIDGAGVGYDGIVFNSGFSLTVSNCVLKNFYYDGTGRTGDGILIQASSGNLSFFIKETTASDNGNGGVAIYQAGGAVKGLITDTNLSNGAYGVYYIALSGAPSINIALDHVVAFNNFSDGLTFEQSPGLGTADIAISNSTVSMNNVGINAAGGNALTMSIDNTTLNGNSVGINASTPAAVMLSRSVIQGNGTGTGNSTANTFYTYGNNVIDLNGTNFSGGALYSGVTLR